LSEVFVSACELDAAYDFVESEHVRVERVEAAVGRATARSCRGGGRIRIAVDGSSANVVDRTNQKGFGQIGTNSTTARGLKVMTALAVDQDGATVGVLAQSYWARPVGRPRRSAARKALDRARKSPAQKETRHWLEVIERAADRLDEEQTLGWFQLDREGDAWPTLRALDHSGHWFTVRSAWDRVVEGTGRDRYHLRAHMAARRPIATYELSVSAGKARQARQARMVVRAASVTLRLHDKRTRKMLPLTVNIVWVREQGTTPRGEKPLDWMLLTNAPIGDVEQARDVVAGYATRWRIEDFHKSWKSGACNIEHTQLRSRDAVIRWATILAVVAARVERLKHLSRTDPSRAASDEFTRIELEVLMALKRRYKKRTESVPDGTPSMTQAVRWLADLGGYTGKSSGGPPGSVTIARGLDRLRTAVEGVLAMRGAHK